jgi:hypothetical protein
MRYLFALALLWPLSAQAGWFNYDNYDDCMLGKMKGQDRSMYSTADKECKRQFGVEFSVRESSIKWSFGRDGLHTKVTIEDAGEYEITSGVFRFSEKPCAEIKSDQDFSQAYPIKFNNGIGVNTWSISDHHCAQIDELRGKYK